MTAQTRRRVFLVCLVVGVAVAASAPRFWGTRGAYAAARTESASAKPQRAGAAAHGRCGSPWKEHLDEHVYRLTNQTEGGAVSCLFASLQAESTNTATAS